MSSIDVIRGLAHRRYSCLQMYKHWFEYGIIPDAPYDLDGCHNLLKDLVSSDGSTEDQDPVHAVTGCSFETLQGPVASLEMELAKRGGGGGCPTAIMASQNHSPTSLTPSGVCAGVGGGDGRNHLHSTPYPFSKLSSGAQNETECLEKFKSLTISDNTLEEVSKCYNQNVEDLLGLLKQFGVTSRPVPYRSLEKRRESPEIFCKNLFVKDRRGQFFLIICDENQAMDLKWLKRKLNAYRNFSFATGYEMYSILHMEPGGVTPFALMHGTARDVRVVITTDLTSDPEVLLNFHPLDQNLTLPIKIDHLEKFLQHYRVDLEYIDMDN